MGFLRSITYFDRRFHAHQEEAWLAYKAGLDLVLPWGRRSGKCLATGSLIATPKGPVEIERLKAGDEVYSEYGKPIKVVAVEYQGKKPIVDLTAHGVVLASCTTDHRWLTTRENVKVDKVRAVSEFYRNVSIVKKYVESSLGSVSVPDAYAIGAFLGDGCRIKQGKVLYLSAESREVPEAVAKVLGLKAFRLHKDNHTWKIGAYYDGRHEKEPTLSHYRDWIHGRLAHEKRADLEVIKTWDRESLLNYLAGLLDTDGSVCVHKGRLVIRWGMQAQSVIESVRWALLALWQIPANVTLDKRAKYKNGPMHLVGVSHNGFCKRILRELSPYLALDRKRWKDEYSELVERNWNANMSGVKVSEPRLEDCWDLQVESDSHLFLTATGLVSHNTELISQLMIEDIEEYGKPCLYVAKTRRQAVEIVWEKFAQALRGQDSWRLYDSALECYHKPSGAIIRIKGVDKDADNLAGSGYRIIACDEYALWKKPDVVGRILSPMLGDYNGQMIFTSTKRGKNHFYKRHQDALKQPEKYFVSEATMFDNSFLSDEGRAKVLSEYEGGEKNPLYRQEVLNEYVTFEGQVVAVPEEQWVERRWDAAELDHAWHWRGMDLGYSPDPTACVWVAYNRRRNYFQVYSEYEHQALLIREHAEIITAHEPYPIISTISDNDPQVLAEFEAVGFPVSPADKTGKKARVLRMVNMLMSGKLKVSSGCTRLINQLQSYTWDAVDAGNDPHLIDALRYVCTNVDIPQLTDEEKGFDFHPRRSNSNWERSQSFDD